MIATAAVRPSVERPASPGRRRKHLKHAAVYRLFEAEWTVREIAQAVELSPGHVSRVIADVERRYGGDHAPN